MFIETWLHLREFFEAIYTGLNRADQKYAVLLFPFIENNKHKNTGIPQGDLDNILLFLNDNVLPQAGYEVRGDVYQAINFIAAVNKGRAAKSLYTIAGCKFWDNFWYDGSCHTEREFVPVVEPEPEEEPEPVIDEERPFKPIIEPSLRDCSEWLDRGSCSKMGCYWYKGKCWDSIEDYLLNFLGWEIEEKHLDVSNEAVKNSMEYMKALTEFFINDIGVNAVFAQEAAVMQLLGVKVETVLDAGLRNVQHITEKIGDIGKLNGKTVVDAILSVEGGGEAKLQVFIERILDDLEYQYNIDNQTVSMNANGLLDNLLKIEKALIDSQGVITIPTIENVEERLNQAYSDTNDNAMPFLRHLDYSYGQLFGVAQDTGMSLRQIVQQMLVSVSSIIDVVSGDIIREEFPLAEHALDFLPATYGWVKQKLTAVGNIIFDCIEAVTQDLAEQINTVGTIVVQMPDWWITKLKERLGI